MIDTPSFGHIRPDGSKDDKTVNLLLEKWLTDSHGLKELDKIFLFVHSADNRVDTITKEAFSRLTKLYDNDLVGRILGFFSHCSINDLPPANAINKLKSFNIPLVDHETPARNQIYLVENNDSHWMIDLDAPKRN